MSIWCPGPSGVTACLYPLCSPHPGPLPPAGWPKIYNFRSLKLALGAEYGNCQARIQEIIICHLHTPLAPPTHML
jgi:hypothetical protein